jgi:glycosyltransferase involved in cell wall biosynthesis
MRIAIDARLISGTNTGDSTYWTCLVETLIREHSEHEIIFISNKPRPREVPFGPNCSWLVVPGEGRMWSLVKLPMAARKAKADVLHVQYSLSPLAKNGVTTIHDTSFFIGPEWFSEGDLRSLRKSIPLAAKAAKRIVTVSNTSKAEIERFLPAAKGKVVVAHNARPPWIKPVEAKECEQVLRELGVQAPFLLTVGTNWARKNQELAVAAVNSLPSELPHKLVVTGKATHSLSSARVQPVGYVSEHQLSALYSSASLYLAPSLHEGFGIPLVEAFGCGCPVICGMGGAMPEVAGKAARVTNSYAAADWSEAVTSLLREPSTLEDLRQRGFARDQQFSWSESARQHVRAYEEACRRLTSDS